MTGDMRYFNTAGPVKPAKHYHVPPLSRLDVDNLLELLRQEKYFALHAPRQTGKTSTLLALRRELNDCGEFRCAYVNVEVGQSSREDVGAAMQAILSALARGARHSLDDRFVAGIWRDVLEEAGPHDALGETLARWAESDARPLVLLIDEIDALVGDSLVSVLRQLRAGYPERPRRFPQSVILCGVRDVRDYRMHSPSGREIIAGGSAFNIRAESLRLGDFSRREVESLLAQHREDTGQPFTDGAHAAVWELTRGQPWLVNALAYEACFRDEAGRDRERPVRAIAIRGARDRLILRRETHLEQLTDKLREERVRRVIEPLLSGSAAIAPIPVDDLDYARDLGLVARENPIAIANPIYREMIPRDLTHTTQAGFEHDAAWYVDEGGALRANDLLAAFQDFFRQHSEHWVERFQYKGAGPQLLLQAFLQRIVNSGGRIEREYGLGRGRTDLLIVWPLAATPRRTEVDADGRIGTRPATQKIVVECKVLRSGPARTLRDGLEQTRAYMDRCAAPEGHLVIFDRDEDKSWDRKIYIREETGGGAPVTVWGM
ncbi:AAA family ATPase [Candidatus Palauibacter sp.]|uniref:AAA family ATPase n=1 Tax=Candidatus Palauibacter sp. TaxID=3101350 RepID=UPI003AF2B812